MILPVGVAPEARLLLIGRALRAFCDGYVAVLLPAYLLALGFGIWEVGVLSTATLLGSALATLAVGAWGHRFHHRALLLGAALLMAATGLAFAGLSSFWPLLLVAFAGTMNPSSGDVSVFLPLEHARLAEAAQGETRTALFARYSLTGALFAAVGALAAAVPDALVPLGIERIATLRGMFVIYGVAGLLVWHLYRRLPEPAPHESPAPPVPLGVSRHTVRKLAALFSVDAFAGGLVVNSLLALWLFERFDLSLAAAGHFFFWSGLLSAFSQLAAPWVAKRIGLLNTMVFTHIPANIFLVLAALAPTPGVGPGIAAAPVAVVANGRPDALGFRHGGGHATGTRGGGQLYGRAAQSGGGGRPFAGRRIVRRRLAGRTPGRQRNVENRLRSGNLAGLPPGFATGTLRRAYRTTPPDAARARGAALS